MSLPCVADIVAAASVAAARPPLRPRLVSLVVDAAQPYARALYGEDGVAAEVFAAAMARPAAEIAIERTRVLMEGGELRGCYVALPGGEVRAGRRQELLEALRLLGSARIAGMRQRLVELAGLFAPVADDEFYLSKLAVEPAARGRGLGRVLLQHYVERGQQLGFRRFRLDVSADNTAARALYAHAGFEVAEKRRCHPFDLTYLAMVRAS